MSKTKAIILSCCVAIAIAALFSCTQRMKGGTAVEAPDRQLIRTYQAFATPIEPADEKPDPQLIRKYQARTSEMIIAGLKKRYHRDDTGCVDKVEFYNDAAKCKENEECHEYLKKWLETCQDKEKCPVTQWVEAIVPKEWPRIWDEYLVGAGSTTGVSGSDVCVEWRFTVAGSPGWDCDYIGGTLVCSCIGYYVPPPYDMCCQPKGCRRRP